MKCPQCQHENPTGSSFCLECGARLGLTCDSCGTDLPAGSKFCNRCGTAVGSPTAHRPRFASPDSYTPKHLAEKILTSKAALEGERKQVTVLFADLKGSMELLADRDPEEARKILDPVLERMMEAVHRYEGTVNQVMGDGIMALFGAPVAHEDHAVRACYAALWMQDAIRRYTEGVRRSHGLEVQIRIGLNSGEVVVRAIGNDLSMDYTAVGQTTHLAARMEQLAPPGTIRLTVNTLRLVGGYVEAKSLGPIPVKGLAEPIEVYEVVGAGAARSRLQAAAARGLTRFVGREDELDQLTRALDAARAGHGQVVAVVGEAGVGKSRLYWEFTHSHRSRDCLIVESASVSYGKATAYLPITHFLRAYFRIDALDDARRIREKVTGKILALDRALEPALPALLALLDIPVEDPEWEGLAPPLRRQRTLDTVKRLLLRESQMQPFVILFEDLHWIDAETQTLLESLVESLPTARILLLVNYRPEYHHGWGSRTYYRQIRIDPLPPESAGELLAALLGANPGLQPLKQLLVERTEGNPFFMEECVQMLVETGVLAGERGAYALAQTLRSMKVPGTVRAVLAARIDRLSPDEKHLLQTASVIGKDVPLSLLGAVAELPEEVLHTRLARLRATEFLYEGSLFPDIEYTFKHALTLEVAYQSLLGERRRELHGRIADAMEALYADRLTEQVERLAHHALHGARVAQAVKYLHQAGDKAVARSANREAVAFLEDALRVLAELPENRETLAEALEIRLALGTSLIAVAGPSAPQTYAVYRQARELCDRVGDASRLFPVLWGQWFTTIQHGDYQSSRELAEQLLAAARERGDSALLLEGHHSVWATLCILGEFGPARKHFDDGLRLYDPRQHRGHAFVYGGHDPGVCCRNFLSLALWELGYPDQAVRRSEEALSLARELDHPMSLIWANLYGTFLRYNRRELRAATERVEAVLTVSTAHGSAAWSGYGSLLRAALRAEQGDDADLLRDVERGLAAARAASWGFREMWLMGRLVEACAKAGHAGRGLEVMAEMLAQPTIASLDDPELHRVQGELLLSAGAAPGDAETTFRRAVAAARRRQARSRELRAVTSLCRLLNRQGRGEEGRQMLAETYGWFTEGFETADLRDAKTLLDEVSAASG